MKQVNFRIPDSIYQRLTNLAEKTGHKQTYFVKEALLQHLEDLEDAYLAVERLKNPTELYTLEEVEKYLGLDD